MSLSFDRDHWALILGGSSGFGLATAQKLARHGMNVAVVHRDRRGAMSGIEPELVARADRLEVLPGLELPVATVGDLIALKLLARDDARRPQDAADLVALLAVATRADRERAETAIGEITARGFQRDRDLAAEWRRWLEGESS